MISVINEKRASEYPTIAALENEIIASNLAQSPEKIQPLLGKYAGQSWFALFEITDTPTSPIITPLITST
jgi:hypothetical protein